MKEQSQDKIEARFGLSMLKNPYNNLLFDHIDRFEFFLIFWGQILSYLPLLQEGTTAELPALGSSHNRPCPYVVSTDAATAAKLHTAKCCKNLVLSLTPYFNKYLQIQVHVYSAPKTRTDEHIIDIFVEINAKIRITFDFLHQNSHIRLNILSSSGKTFNVRSSTMPAQSLTL